MVQNDVKVAVHLAKSDRGVAFRLRELGREREKQEQSLRELVAALREHAREPDLMGVHGGQGVEASRSDALVSVRQTGGTPAIPT